MNKLNLWLLLLVLIIPFGLSASLNGTSSIYSFVVSNCQADEVSVNCSAETIKFSCDVSNKQFIDFLEFRIDGTLYNASFLGITASVDFIKPLQTATINTTILFDRIYITDTNSDTAVFDDNVSVLNDCLTCTDIGYSDSCSITDNTTFYHIFEPSGCDIDFNESVSCDYCEEDLLQTLGDCLSNNTQSVQYSDLNFFSCCDITGLGSDCSILVYPYNETTFQNCNFLVQDFSCDIPEIVEFTDRMAFSCELPDDDSYSCVVNVFEDDRLVQVNPEFSSYSTGLLTILPKDVEPKEFFRPENRVLNAYFTKKNLLTDKDFVVEVKCSSDTDTIVSQELVNPFYKQNFWVLNRTTWFISDMTYIVFAILIFIIIAVVVIIIYRGVVK